MPPARAPRRGAVPPPASRARTPPPQDRERASGTRHGSHGDTCPSRPSVMRPCVVYSHARRGHAQRPRQHAAPRSVSPPPSQHAASPSPSLRPRPLAIARRRRRRLHHKTTAPGGNPPNIRRERHHPHGRRRAPDRARTAVHARPSHAASRARRRRRGHRARSVGAQ